MSSSAKLRCLRLEGLIGVPASSKDEALVIVQIPECLYLP